MLRKKVLYAALCALVAVACRNGGGHTETRCSARSFPMISVPSLYSDNLQKAEYTLLHFWDAFSDTSAIYLSDSLHSNGVPKDEIDEWFSQFAVLAQNLQDGGSKCVSEAMKNMYANMVKCQKADSLSNVFRTLAGMSEKYFYGPNSPCRDEDIYLTLVRQFAKSEYAGPGERYAYEFDAGMCALNRKGTVAADISFTDPAGHILSLHDIKADYIILMFSNPGCTNCTEVMEELTSNVFLKDLVGNGCSLKVVNIYIDSEIDKWKEYVHNYPSSWICGYDHNYIIRTDLTYNVRAIPSLYLLSGDKTVIMKDATTDRIIKYILSNA